MAMTPGLSPNIRLPDDVNHDDDGLGPISVEIVEDNEDAPELDKEGNVIKIEHGDGSVTVSLDGTPIERARKKRNKGGWFDNLAEDMPDMELSSVAEDLLRGIDEDIASRQEWIDTRATGIKLLGLTIDIPGSSGAGDGSAPLDGMSKVRHPLLLEAVLRFQANARGEMLPTDGPFKVRNDDIDADLAEDELADDFQRDMNHFLTSTATEYYPDTDRMMFQVGFSGDGFKKVYNCPLRGRPVSESVDADDLIVNFAATDLHNAKRVTHRIMMRPSVVRRMQLIGAYRDLALGTPLPPKTNSLKEAEQDQQGLSAPSTRPEDRDHEIYECYCELDLKQYPHEFEGEETGLEVPYRVTIDVSSKTILSIVRNYKEETKELPVARRVFVKFPFVPGLGFYDIGLLHILGNTTNAMTAAWREMLDSGMYANFPGFLIADTGARQNTNNFRVPPGGGAIVKTAGQPIRDAIMPLPYNTGGMPALASLVQNMEAAGQRLGGTSELQVGEGRADAPVGTTLALIEQATKVLDAVHKRMHTAQAEEFELLVECFRENPKAFVHRKRNPSKRKWDEAQFLRALDDYDLVPQADPNTASQGQRMMKIMGLKQLEAANPSQYDPIAIDTAAIKAMGWSNPNQFFAPPQAAQQPPPELIKQQAEIANDTKKADATMMDAETRRAAEQAKISTGHYNPQAGLAPPAPEPEPSVVDKALAHAKLIEAKAKETVARNQHHDTMIENAMRDADRSSREKVAALSAAKDIMLHHAEDPNNVEAVPEEAKHLEKDLGIGEGNG